MDIDHSCLYPTAIREGMFQPGRHEHECSGLGNDFLPRHREGELSLQDVEGIVFALVDVRGWAVRMRRHPEEPKVESRRVRAAREELHVADVMSLTAANDYRFHSIRISKGSFARASSTNAFGTSHPLALAADEDRPAEQLSMPAQVKIAITSTPIAELRGVRILRVGVKPLLERLPMQRLVAIPVVC